MSRLDVEDVKTEPHGDLGVDPGSHQQCQTERLVAVGKKMESNKTPVEQRD